MRLLAVTLIVVLLVPNVSAEWSETDPANDVEWTVAYGTADSPPAPLAPAYIAYIDLVLLEIVESDASLTFIFANQQGFETQATDPSPGDRYLTHVVQFEVPGVGTASVDLESSMPPSGPADDGLHPTGATFCILGEPSDSMCYQGGERLSFATGKGKASVALPKETLQGIGLANGGMSIGSIRAFGIHDASRQPPCCQFDSGWFDRLPNSGYAPDFVFANATVNDVEDPPVETERATPAPGPAWLFLVIASVAGTVLVTRRRGSL